MQPGRGSQYPCWQLPDLAISYLAAIAAALLLLATPADAALRSKLIKPPPNNRHLLLAALPRVEAPITAPRRQNDLLAAVLGVTNNFTIVVDIVDKPGPSATLFANPHYTCVTNYYVSTTGNDSTGNGSSGSPWATLQHADSAAPTAGSCINIAPGTYGGLTFSHGGNAATSTGYVVYRCTTMDACTIKGDQVNGDAFVFSTPSGGGSFSNPAYFMFDGFTLVGADGYYQVGVDVENRNTSTAFASHHIWVINSIIQHFGQSGIQLNQGDYFYSIHNTVHDNSKATCGGSEGSGISYAAERPINSLFGYTATTDDINGVPSKFGYSWNWGTSPSGAAYSHFHLVILWNLVYNNSTPDCTGNTDGNGIIMDTLTAACGNGTDYNYPTLIGHNVVANNGSGGIHNFGASYTWMVNNSDYNDYTDPNATNGSRPLVDNHCATTTFPDSFYNNIVVAIAASGTDAPNHSMNIGQSSGGAAAAVGNITYPVPPTMPSSQGTAACNGIYDVVLYDSTNYSCAANKAQTNPLWVNVGNTSPGNYVTPPNGANFALQSTSPAIGFGTVLSWMPAQSGDSGACHHSLSSCP